MRHLKISALLTCWFVLGGCSGGGGGDGAAVPAVDGFVSFTRNLAATAPEDSEPADVDNVTLTSPETDEPVDVG